MTADEIGGQRRQPVIVPFGPALFEATVLAVDISSFLQPLQCCRDEIRLVGARSAADIADQNGFALLCAGRERPCRDCATEPVSARIRNASCASLNASIFGTLPNSVAIRFATMIS